MTTRKHTLRDAAEELGLPLSTLHEWSAMEGAPFDKSGQGKPTKCDPDEVAKWAAGRKLTGRPGRPRNAETDGDSDYWLARWRRAKTLKEEGSVIPLSEHRRIVGALATVSANELRAMPAAIAGALFGRTTEEIETEIERYIGGICDRLSDPANYECEVAVGEPVEAAGAAQTE